MTSKSSVPNWLKIPKPLGQKSSTPKLERVLLTVRGLQFLGFIPTVNRTSKARKVIPKIKNLTVRLNTKRQDGVYLPTEKKSSLLTNSKPVNFNFGRAKMFFSGMSFLHKFLFFLCLNP